MTDEHWDSFYGSNVQSDVSWDQVAPTTSIRLITATTKPCSLIDIGAGASTLADELLARGYVVTVLDIALSAIESVRARLGDRATYVVADLSDWMPGTTYDAGHRAVFHFLTDPMAQAAYVDLAATTVRPGGTFLLGTFASDGPTTCSGLATARYDADTLAAAFADSFELVSIERVEHNTPWGSRQPFTWVTLRRRL